MFIGQGQVAWPNLSGLTVKSLDDVAAQRKKMIRRIWGQDTLPTAPTLTDAGGGTYTYTLATPAFVSNNAVYSMTFSAQTGVSKGKLVIYCHGHDDPEAAGSTTVAEVNAQLNPQGYDVLHVHMPGLAPNTWKWSSSITGHNAIIKNLGLGAYKFFFEHVLAAINYFTANGYAGKIYLVGKSGGGWTSCLMAAMDTRIKYSAPCCGTSPLYMRKLFTGAASVTSPQGAAHNHRGATDSGANCDLEQFFSEFYEGLDYLDIYAMAACNGKQHLFFNEIDSCCFDGAQSLHDPYKTAVQNIVTPMGGAFDVTVFNDANTAHHIAASAWTTILNEMGTL